MKLLFFTIFLFSMDLIARDLEGAANAFTNKARAISGILVAVPFFLAAGAFSSGAQEWGKRFGVGGILAIVCYYGHESIQSLIKNILGQ